MTPEEAEEFVEEVRFLASMADDEGAHVKEDALYHRFIRVVATMPDNNAEYTWFDVVDLISAAKAILETEAMDFERWYA